MIYILTAVKDRQLEAYQPLVTVRAEGEAIRSFKDAINNEQAGPIYKHPDDFDLYVLGTYEDTSGQITPCDPRKIADGKNEAQRGE